MPKAKRLKDAMTIAVGRNAGAAIKAFTPIVPNKKLTMDVAKT